MSPVWAGRLAPVTMRFSSHEIHHVLYTTSASPIYCTKEHDRSIDDVHTIILGLIFYNYRDILVGLAKMNG